MFNLRNKLIRLAHNNPSMRADILPLLSDKVASGAEIVIGQNGKGNLVKKPIGGTDSLKEGLALAKAELSKLGIKNMRPTMSSYGSRGLAVESFASGDYFLSISYSGKGMSNKALSNWGKKLASKTAASNESIADVMNVWFNQFGKDMVKYNKAVKVTKVTHTYIAFEANDKKGRLDIDAVGGLECEIDGKLSLIHI